MRPSVLVLSLLFAVGCGKKDDVVTAPTAASSAAQPPSPPTPTIWHYVVGGDGTAHVDIAGAKQHIQGDATVSMGSLDIVGDDLAKSRGSVLFDLASFSTHTFGNGDDDVQTSRARTWLEVGSPEMRWASLAIRSIDALSSSALSQVAPTREGTEDVRTVTLTVHGDLLLHGSKVQEDCPLEVRFRYPAGAAADTRPTRIEITSKKPMPVVLKNVDVQPRDAHGKAGKWTADLLAKVGPSADVTVNLKATPAM